MSSSKFLVLPSSGKVTRGSSLSGTSTMFSNDDLNLLCNSFIVDEFERLTSSSVIDVGCVMEARELKLILNNYIVFKHFKVVLNLRF